MSEKKMRLILKRIVDKRLLGFGKIGPFEVLKSLEEPVKTVMVDS